MVTTVARPAKHAPTALGCPCRRPIQAPLPANSERILGPIAAPRRSRFSGLATFTSGNRFHSSGGRDDPRVDLSRAAAAQALSSAPCSIGSRWLLRSNQDIHP